MAAQPTTESFGVYCAGEQIDDNGPSLTYIYVSTHLGRLRMTAEEAEQLGSALIAAADYDRSLDDEEQTS